MFWVMYWSPNPVKWGAVKKCRLFYNRNNAIAFVEDRDASVIEWGIPGLF